MSFVGRADPLTTNVSILQAVHTFLKTDPRLPPLETDTVAATSDPEAAAAAAEAAALEAAAEAAKPLWQRHKDPFWLKPEQIEAQKQKDAEALNIIRVRLAEDVQGLARKRGVAAQNNQQKVGATSRHAAALAPAFVRGRSR